MIWGKMDKFKLLLFFWTFGGSLACDQTDHKVTPMQDIENLEVIEEDKLGDYTNFFIDRPNRQIILGIENHLLRLDLDSLEVKQKVAWEVVPVAKSTCLAKGHAEDQCNNFIRVLLPYQDRFLACGTGAFFPICSWRKLDDLEPILEEMSGIAISPYDPRHNSTALMSREGAVYTAMAMDYQSRDYSVVRPLGHSFPLRSMDHSKWLSDPDFVASFDVGLYVYFFFREVAQEDSDKTVFSRVLRIAKDDTGGQNFMKQIWTTFTKARLNCSIPGHYPFYFNELQSAYFLEEEGLFYAIFTTPRNSIHGSAICTFNLTDVEQAFESNYLYQENSRMAWVQKENIYKNTHTVQRSMSDSQKYQLMYEAVQPIGNQPIYSDMLEGIVLTEIAIDTIQGLHDAVYQVIFAGTETGVIKKMVVPRGSAETCLVEEIVLFPEGNQTAIKKLLLDSEKGLLLVGTDVKLLRFPLERCSSFQTKRACLEANDPYCGWNQISRHCARLPENADPQVWHQDVSRCPIINPVPVDGQYGAWTAWSTCNQMTRNWDAACMCRSRQCDSPPPSCGGQSCDSSHGIQVANCTVHGGWSAWGAWSNCMATCGNGVRVRERTCTNPAPKYGGRMCLGPSDDVKPCNSGACPGYWKPWGDWSECDQECGGGQQSRERQCSNSNCQGDAHQSLPCNTQPCRDNRNLNSEIPLGDLAEIESVVSVNGEWGKWRVWTLCSASCNGGTQSRSRECDSPSPSGRGQPCPGISTQQRACNYHPCPGVGNKLWSCWSDWSECSESCVKQRVRTCPGGKTAKCDREETQQQECDTDACATGENGWKEWSDWSECDPLGVKVRSRVCGWEKPPESLCQGENIQIESCNTSAIIGTKAASSSAENEKTGVSYMYIIIAAISGGLTCSVLTVLAISICYKPKRRQRHRTDSHSSYVSNASNSGINVFSSYNANNNSYATTFASPPPRQYNNTRKGSLPQTNGKKKLNSSRKKSLDAPYMGTL